MARILGKIEAHWGVFKFNADATRCAEEIRTCLSDTFTSQELVELAKNPSTELHKCFEWDDSKAAHKYRIRQAHDVARSLQITYIDTRGDDPEEKSVRMFYNNGRNTGYQSVSRIVSIDSEYDKLLKQAKADLADFKIRYSTILELQSVIDAIDEVLG